MWQKNPRFHYTSWDLFTASGVVQLVAHGPLEPRILVRVQAPEPLSFVYSIEISNLWITNLSSIREKLQRAERQEKALSSIAEAQG